MLDSGDSTGIQLAAVLILLMLSAFFSSAETALTLSLIHISEPTRP